MKDAYYCFGQYGEKPLPGLNEISCILNEGIEPVIFIDSCVCLDIIKTIDYRNKAQNVDRKKLVSLKEYISKTKIRLSPIFGLIELCYQGGIFNESKFWDFQRRIDFFIDVPKRTFNSLKFDFTKDYLILKRPQLLGNNPYNELEPFFLSTYCALLKIRALSLRDISGKRAEENSLELLAWMVDDLKIMLGREYKLGLNIFGGVTEFRKMIWLDGKQELIKKKLIGTTWDLLHSRFCSDNMMLKKALGSNIAAHFLTNDYSLFKLLYKYSLTIIVDAGQEIGITRVNNSNYDLPHLKGAFLDKQNRIMIDLLSTRFNKKIDFHKQRVLSLIDELEKQNGIKL